MVSVGDCDGQRVRGIGSGDLGSRQQPLDHRVDLRFLGVADAHNRLLDEAGGIFADLDACASRNHQYDPPRLPQFQGRLRVLVDENFLDSRRIGPTIDDQRFKLRCKVGQPFRQCFSSIGLQLAIVDVGQAIAPGLDQAPTGRAEPGVETENDQASFSSSSSGTS